MHLSKNSFIITSLLVLVLAIIGVWVFLFQPEPIKNSDSEGQVIVAFGDSLVQGVGASSKTTNFISLMETDLKQPIINLGHSGDTSEAALLRVDDVIKQKPKVVILLIGGNDFLRKVPIDTTFKNISSIIEQIQASGSAVLLLGVRGGIIQDQFAPRYEELSRKYQTGYVPDVLKGLLGKQELMYDAIHPNDKGYAIIKDRVEPVLKDMLSQMK